MLLQQVLRGLNFFIMTNMIFFIPIEDIDVFKEKASEMGVQILDVTPFKHHGITQIKALAEDLTGIYILGTMVGYSKAYQECTESMNNALSKVEEIKSQFEKFKGISSELEELKKQKL